jgi:D-arabinan exo alpha-(1,3)/(1,5)-arabinofuranosidase (non-reducing end)
MQTPSGYGQHGSSLRDLPRLRASRRRRASSFDPTGGNDDRLYLAPGERAVIADLAGPGSINHLWCTVAPARDPDLDTPEVRDMLRRLVLRITWDDAEAPAVLVPLGDFFGVGFGRTTTFASLPLQMSPRDGRGMNCFFHMPFRSRARVEIVSEMAAEDVLVYFYVDWEAFDALEDGLARFHAQWRRENPAPGIDERGLGNATFQHGGRNVTGAENYTILEAEGHGHYVGCVLNVQNLRATDAWNWYGEGDDMIFIDGEPFPPSLHGTGTEDYFGTAWCPDEPFSAPYHGLTLTGGPNWAGQHSMYRFHVEDPVTFARSIRVTIEHGHANRRSDDLSSVAYWYQAPPHRPFGLPRVDDRLARWEPA